ncbi:MAG TPA: efflux RND transporter periplasmic adaptor subunit [Alphaproteobacteria bacterium]|nr:efflux RND transporter periplasmic adaptor subunit [Alphaproteobacteria bacterium]
MRRTGLAIALPALFAALLVACGEEPEKPVEYIRAIKTFTVSEVASGQTRKYAATVQATTSSVLSFQVSGNVQKVLVKPGDRVRKGQVLAVLDKKPYELDVQAARAELSKAEADRAQKRSELERQRALFAKGWIAKSRLEQHQSAYESAVGQVNIATSKLSLTRRDLANTELAAPFDGTISEKLVDPFTDVKAGQKLFEIDASGALEVAFDVPENTIARLALGMPVTITFSTPKSCRCKGRITEIGSKAGTANAFPVKASLVDPPASARSGMSAQVLVRLQNDSQITGFFVPIAALAPAPDQKQGHGYVFVYQPATKTVKKLLVRGSGVQENLIAIEGVKQGDVIAVAGVNFLVDGQKVKLMAAN